MSPEQKAALKAHINESSDLNIYPNAPDGNATVETLLNLDASPDFWVWKRAVGQDEIQGNPGFDWTRVDNLSIGKARVWDWMFGDGSINPSQANIRTGIAAVWVGTSADLDVRAVVLALCRRKATRFEKLFSTGTGSTASPAVMALEGPVTAGEIETARDS